MIICIKYSLAISSEEVLRQLKEEKHKVILFGNSSRPEAKRSTVSAIEHLVDGVHFSSELGSQKPSPEFFQKIQEIHQISDLSSVFIIGDKLESDLQLALNTNTKGIWVNFKTNESNTRALNNGFPYPRTILSMYYLPSAIQFYEPGGVLIGYINVTEKKKQNLGKKLCFESTSTHWFNALEPLGNLEVQGEYSVIVHKAGDYLHMDKQEVIQKIDEYIQRRPNLKVIDPLDSIQYGLTRGAYYKKIHSDINAGVILQGVKFRLPWQMDLGEITDEACELILQEMTSNAVRFPILIKTDQAQFSKNAHLICVVFSTEGITEALALFNEKLIIQEFVNHDKIVYKIYVIGDNVQYFTRPSCSNIIHSQLNMVSFQSYDPWPDELKSPDEPVLREIDMNVLGSIAKLLKSSISMSIIGVDILVQSETLDHVLVDINPFPGFKEFSEIGSYIRSFISNS